MQDVIGCLGHNTKTLGYGLGVPVCGLAEPGLDVSANVVVML